MLGVTDLSTYVLGTIAIILLPGPNSLFVLTTAASRGVKQGYRAAFGVFAGDAILMLLSAAGVASLLKAFPPLFYVVKYVGAAYLAYLGIKLIVSVVRRRRNGAEEPMVLEEGNPFRKAFVISLMNPKAILFFISFFIQFVEPGYAYQALSFLLLATIAQFFSAAYLTVLIFSGSFLADTFRRKQILSKVGTTLVGSLFIGFGLKLATSSL